MKKSKVSLLFLWISSLAFILGASNILSVFAQEENTQYDFIINNFDSQIDVQENGDLKIQEHITVTFNEAKHGIYRSIPYQYQQSGQIIRTAISNISVANQEYTSYSESNNKIIKIGSSNLTLAAWTMLTYDISYKVEGWIRAYSGYQELYWNIIWNDRDVPIQKSQFQINLPVPFVKDNQNRFAYFGEYGSRNILSTVQFQDSSIQGTEANGLKPHEGITIGLKFPENTFILPKINKTLESLFTYAFYLVPLCLFFYLYRLWRKYGKDYPLPDVVQYYPPDNLTPPEIKAFFTRNINANDMVSLLYKRAWQGFITIEKKEDSGFWHSNNYILHKLKEINSKQKIKDFEKVLFDEIFASEKSVNISDRKDLYGSLEQAANTVYAMYSYAPNYTPESKSAFWKMLMIVIFLPLWVAISLIIILWIITYILSSIDPNTMNDIAFTLDSVISSHFGTLILIILLTIATAIFFLSIIYAKTSEYEILLSKIRGYKTFLEKVEKPKLKTLLREDPNFIDKALPYAVVLGVAGVFLKIANEVIEWGYHPTWFLGNNMNILNDIKNIEGSTWTKPPSPSWGGSFGGSGWFSSWWWFSGGGWGWGGGGSR